ncbi:Mediator complex [Macleaya cordata]|uniref:Mediator of RNA polymerase II transcription subunit 17 n=1 Tax=Macleaya cordata TaxID=56857 RepID=A0A200PQI6_MACCD|nr:Mediator complex [Macleaya cordata]
MDGNLEISLDKLPIKRLEAIEENGIERFAPDVGYDQKRLDLIRRIDFAWAVEKDTKKQKTSKETTAPWPWQSMVENLQLAHQELSVIIDLINTVEANDAVTVAGMTRPKQLPNEVLSDLSVSAATKLQCFRHLGKYLKQSAQALEQQVAREARFYGALIRLQQNWKVKRQRLAVSAPNNESFTIDLFDNSLSDPTALFRPPSISTIRVDHDSAGMLAVNLPPKSCRSIHFGFLGVGLGFKARKSSKTNISASVAKKESVRDEDVDECVKETHLVLREVHQAIFDEQVFDLVNREAFNPSPGVNVTGIRENYLELGIGQGASVFLSLLPSEQDEDQTADPAGTQNLETAIIPSDTFDGVRMAEEKPDVLKRLSGFPNPTSCEIHLQQIFHENIFVRAKDRRPYASKSRIPVQTAGVGLDLLGHFCMTLAHRIFSSKVLEELENLATRVPYLHLLSHPTWNSRTSSWSLTMKVPQSILRAERRTRLSDTHSRKNEVRSQFQTKVVVNDDCIKIEGEGAPNVVGLFNGTSEEICSMNNYDCDLADLPVILLEQVASQVVRWLHEEALMVGMNASRDFLCLSFELDQGDRLCLLAHVDPKDTLGCISWWLLMADGLMEEGKLQADLANGGSENMKFLGHLSLEALFSIMMDLTAFVYLFNSVIMSGGTPVAGGLMRQRHSQGYASSGDDLEDDACSRMATPTHQIPRARTWIEVLENLLWIASAIFIVYFGDRRSNFIYLLWHDNRIRRTPLYLGMVGIILNIGIFFYTGLLAWGIRKSDDKWEVLTPSFAPFVTLSGLFSFCLFSFALWPIWSFLTLPLLILSIPKRKAVETAFVNRLPEVEDGLLLYMQIDVLG